MQLLKFKNFFYYPKRSRPLVGVLCFVHAYACAHGIASMPVNMEVHAIFKGILVDFYPVRAATPGVS